MQLLWITRPLLPDERLLVATFFLLVLAELAVLIVPSEVGAPIPFHPHHVAERYGLFTIIVLGEVILASVQAIQGAIADPPPAARRGTPPRTRRRWVPARSCGC